jgi:predicted nucleic acid-binding protein
MIALDTGILIYGLQSRRDLAATTGDAEHESRIVRAAALIDEIRTAGKRCMIPAPAAWEYVLDFPIDEQSRIWASLEGFAIPPFDQAAARIAAQLARKHYDSVVRSQKGKGKQQARRQGARSFLKIDMQIVAIAMAHRAEKLYTVDTEDFSAIAPAGLTIQGLPQAQKKIQFPD